MQSADKLFSNRRPRPLSQSASLTLSAGIMAARKLGIWHSSNCLLPHAWSPGPPSHTGAATVLRCERKHSAVSLLGLSIYSYISFKASLSPKHLLASSFPQALNSSPYED